MPTFLFLIFALILILIVYFRRGIFQYVRQLYLLRNIPMPEGCLPLLGHSQLIETDSAVFYKQMMNYCNDFVGQPVFMIWVGPKPMVICNLPPTVETIFGSNEILSKSFQYDLLYRWIGYGLLTAPPEKWRPRRKLLTPAFHFSILQNYFDLMNEHSRMLLEAVDTKLSIVSQEGQKNVIDIHPFIVSSALDVICEAAMGYNLNSVKDTNHPYALAITQMTDVVMQRMKKPHMFIDWIFSLTALGRKHDKLLNVIHSFTSKVIEERRTEMLEAGLLKAVDLNDLSGSKKKWKLAFLDLLLHEQYNNGSLSDSDIQEEVDTFMFEGHDTTAVAMTWCLYLLGLNPRVQEKLQAELDEILPNRNSHVTNEDIGKLQYLDKVLKESLRLFPSVPFFGRKVMKDFVLDKHLIPVGTTVIVFAPSLHRNPDVFANADDFCPERFEETGRHPYSYIPFSAGPRNCIGAKFAQLEMKILLSWFMRQFTLKSIAPLEECRPAGDIILKPSRGIFLEINHRD